MSTETLILRLEDTLEHHLQQSRIQVLMRDALKRRRAAKKGWKTRRAARA